jgi:hypothetical protein
MADRDDRPTSRSRRPFLEIAIRAEKRAGKLAAEDGIRKKLSALGFSQS